MDGYMLTAAAGVTGALLGAISTIGSQAIQSRIQRRRESGSVETADAQTLFSASNQLIQMLLQQNTSLHTRIDSIGDEIEALMRELRRLIEMQKEQTVLLTEIRENGGNT